MTALSGVDVLKRIPVCLAVLSFLLVSLPFHLELSGAEGHSRNGGDTLYVSESGSTWSAIQDAIDNATAGDTIFVAPGNYTRGFLLLKDGITIIGNSSGDVNIRYPGEEAVIGISSDDSVIGGLNIIEDVGHVNLLMISQCRNLTLRDITMESSLSHCMYVTDCTNISLENLQIDSGERQAIQFRDIWGLEMDMFEISSSGSPDAISFSNDCIDVRISNGSITMDHQKSIAFQSEDEIGVVLDNVSAFYDHEFFNMSSGSVVCYDTVFDPEDAVITSSSVNDTFDAYVRKQITVHMEERDGNITPAPDVELNLTTDLGDEYVTPYYGGSDTTSSSAGTFNGPFELMIFNLTGGEFPYTEGSASLEAYFPEADRNGTVRIAEIDLSNKDEIIVVFRDIRFTNGTIFGKAAYDGGPLGGSNLTNGTAYLWDTRINSTFSKDLAVRNISIDENGTFSFDGVEFSSHYSIWVFPADHAEEGGDTSGYTYGMESVLHHWDDDVDPVAYPMGSFQKMDDYPDTRINLTVSYYEYSPPAEGPVSGTVTYSGGPGDGEGAPNATIELYNITGDLVGERISDENGNFTFENITIGEGYELKATPSRDVLGINNEETGYLFWDGSAFNHTGDSTYNISLKYYDYIPPVDKHPKVAIIDSDNDPLEGVKVTAKIDGNTYTAYTDDNGVAEFTELDGLDFPGGTSFKAELDGYDTIEWDQGDGIPKMDEEEERSDDLLLIWILIGMIVVILIFGTILMLTRRKGPVQEE